MRLFSRAPPLSLIAQALLRAQEATSSTFERNLARFGLMTHGLAQPTEVCRQKRHVDFFQTCSQQPKLSWGVDWGQKTMLEVLRCRFFHFWTRRAFCRVGCEAEKSHVGSKSGNEPPLSDFVVRPIPPGGTPRWCWHAYQSSFQVLIGKFLAKR